MIHVFHVWGYISAQFSCFIEDTQYMSWQHYGHKNCRLPWKKNTWEASLKIRVACELWYLVIMLIRWVQAPQPQRC
jgi:hypothetical protein